MLDLNTHNPDLQLADNLVPAAPSKREMKTWDELSLRSREVRLKLGVDNPRAALESRRKIAGKGGEDLPPSSIDDLLAAVREKRADHLVQHVRAV